MPTGVVVTMPTACIYVEDSGITHSIVFKPSFIEGIPITERSALHVILVLQKLIDKKQAYSS